MDGLSHVCSMRAVVVVVVWVIYLLHLTCTTKKGHMNASHLTVNLFSLSPQELMVKLAAPSIHGTLVRLAQILKFEPPWQSKWELARALS